MDMSHGTCIPGGLLIPTGVMFNKRIPKTQHKRAEKRRIRRTRL